MTTEELKLFQAITDKLAVLHSCYQATAQLMNEHDPQAVILQNLNDQFRVVLDDLDQSGVMS